MSAPASRPVPASASAAPASGGKVPSSRGGPSPQTRTWCFTLNHPERLAPPVVSLLPPPECVKYLVYQHEVGESGTPHIQGYVEFHDKIRMGGIKKLGPAWHAMHLEPRRSTAAKAVHYCSKPMKDCKCEQCEQARLLPPPTGWETFGIPIQNGVGAQYQSAYDACARGLPMAEIAKEFTEEFIKHASGFAAAAALLSGQNLKDWDIGNFPLRPWQQEIVDLVKGPVDRRAIHWYWEPTGNFGKSWLTSYLIKYHSALAVDTTKPNDVLCALQPHHRVIVLDIERSEGMQNAVNFGTLEKLKNGNGFSPKYQSQQKTWNPLHVIVFSNFAPTKEQLARLSEDRWRIVRLGPAPPSPHHYVDIDGRSMSCPSTPDYRTEWHPNLTRTAATYNPMPQSMDEEEEKSSGTN